MIQAQSLRIGNWVKHGDAPSSHEYPNTIFQVTLDMFYDMARNHLMEGHLEPIPLTPEIVLACGFEEEYKSEFTIKYTHKKYSQFGYDWNKTFDWRIRYFGEHFPHIKYLHQLQNLYFALCGKELEINLSNNLK